MNATPPAPNDDPSSKLVGCALLASCLVGLIAAVGGFAAILAQDYVGGGTLLFASAVSFGMLLNALLRS
ncbi:hypothetical protein SAMN06265222_113128 [Neorhodopirellula lusitana]|uniref:Uncharacterized protein n=1 Tax=Neorhodopirellula lusitana TaxID=445327 RepID=A0ABY1QGQ8_9BACT|nr:hypothetical protein [Neorhodopirellula lusitana]SMP70796.1 hypothetical protein SAMN06265222_113128 [Neorhodopirellula lusitana]